MQIGAFPAGYILLKKSEKFGLYTQFFSTNHRFDTGQWDERFLSGKYMYIQSQYKPYKVNVLYVSHVISGSWFKVWQNWLQNIEFYIGKEVHHDIFAQFN